MRESKTPRGICRVPVAPELAPLLAQERNRPVPMNADGPGRYIGVRPDGNDWIFRTGSGKPWHRNQLLQTVKRVGKRAGLDVSCHRLRRTLASSALNAGADLTTVSRILGHSSTQITEASYAELLPATYAKDFLRAVG